MTQHEDPTPAPDLGAGDTEPAAPAVPDEQAGPSHAARKRKWPWIAGAAVVVLAALGLGIAALAGAFTPPEEPAPETAVVTEPEPTRERTPRPTPEPVAEPLPDPTIDIPSTQHMAYSPVWNPPDEGQYFWQIVDPEYGYPEDGGTDFVLAHACENQACAGDQLRLLENGDTLTYMGELYQVQSKTEIMKVDIAAQDIWVHDPNRIVIITCIIDTTWDQSDKNDIIIATRV